MKSLWNWKTSVLFGLEYFIFLIPTSKNFFLRRVHTIAAGKRTQTIESAKAEAEKVRLIGAAEAKSIEAVGRAEAESMRMKAKAYQQYGDEAVMALVLESLPGIAKQVAKPLEKVRHLGGPTFGTNVIWLMKFIILLTSSKQPNLRIPNPQYFVYLLDQQ